MEGEQTFSREIIVDSSSCGTEIELMRRLASSRE